ncbi:putative HAUS augmin-like complex subunit 2 [Helianthus anomalus]
MSFVYLFSWIIFSLLFSLVGIRLSALSHLELLKNLFWILLSANKDFIFFLLNLHFKEKCPRPRSYISKACFISSLNSSLSSWEALMEDLHNLSAGGEKGDDLIRVLRELTSVQRKIADLQVELQGRKEDKNVAHLTHVSEMEKKIETLARITTILKDVIQNKDRIIARLQQPYSLDCIPVEAEYQKQFSELLMKAASDYGLLTSSVADFQWTQNFKEPPSVWGVCFIFYFTNNSLQNNGFTKFMFYCLFYQ